MNTYFNEITSKPVNTVDGKVLYKIPAGAMCGNGDLGVVFDNDEKDLIIHISKCDFWKFANGAHGDGGIKTVGDLRISKVDLSKYNIKQYFDKGLLECKFDQLSTIQMLFLKFCKQFRCLGIILSVKQIQCMIELYLRYECRMGIFTKEFIETVFISRLIHTHITQKSISCRIGSTVILAYSVKHHL